MNQVMEQLTSESAEQTARWRAKHALAQATGNRVADRETVNEVSASAYHSEFNRVMGMENPVECPSCGEAFDRSVHDGELCEGCEWMETAFEDDHTDNVTREEYEDRKLGEYSSDVYDWRIAQKMSTQL